jgi:hypothetical protein
MSTAAAVAAVTAVGAVVSGSMQAEGQKKAAKTAAEAQAASNPWANPYYQAQQAYKMATVNQIFKKNGWEMPKFNPVYDNQGSVVGMTDAPKGMTFAQPNLTPAGQATPNQWDPNRGQFIPYVAPTEEVPVPIGTSEEPGTVEKNKSEEAPEISLKNITAGYNKEQIPLHESIVLRNIIRGQFG